MKLLTSISRLELGVYALSLILCFLLFKQSDLTHTNSSSFAYLYGHFWDFYDYNKSRMGDNNYLPIFYWIFALWNLPLKLIGLIPEVTSVTWLHPTVIQTIWSKLLLAVFFFGSVALVGKIAHQISIETGGGNSALGAKLLFATSPIAIFSVFIFSGYDVFGLFFSLLGLRAYFSKKWKWFAFWFSVAISFKYFAAIIYLPLVLIIEKRFLYLLFFGVSGVAVTALQFALYWHSEVFLGQIFHLVTAKTTGNSVNLRFIFANTAFAILCAYLYFSKSVQNSTAQWYERSIVVCVLSYALFFSWVMWHPQWLILISPFICLLYQFIRSKKSLLIIETLGYLGFVIFTMNNWIGNADNSMLYGGALASWIAPTQTMATDVMGRHWLGFARTSFYSMLFLPVLIWAAEKFWPSTALVSDKQKLLIQQNALSIKILFGIRFLTGAYFFVIICAICLVRG